MKRTRDVQIQVNSFTSSENILSHPVQNIDLSHLHKNEVVNMPGLEIAASPR